MTRTRVAWWRGWFGRGARLATVALVLSGCGPSREAATTVSPDAPTDAQIEVQAYACGQRLHDLCHWLLLHHARHGSLPESLAALKRAFPEADAAAWACPESGRPYVYDPRGLPAPQRGFLILVQEAPPGHAGARLGILVAEPEPASPLVLKVATLSPSTR